MPVNCDEQSDLRDWQWLAEPAQGRLLVELANDTSDELRLMTRLRRQFTTERAKLLVELTELRRRATAKFDRASQMYFTRKGYEQSTDQWLAGYKATRFAGFEAVFDLCSGIGGDAIAMSQSTAVRAIDACPITAWCCRHNLAVYSDLAKQPASVETADVAQASISPDCAWHIDPDRRATRQRVTNFDSLVPGPDLFRRLLDASTHGAIKLAPATQLPDDWSQQCEREWIGRRAECRQQMAWHGDLAHFPGFRRATVLSPAGVSMRTLVAQPAPPRFRPTIGEYVYDVDATVLAAGLVGPLAAGHQLTAWAATEAYLTGSEVNDPALAAFRVDEVLPMRRQTVADWLSSRGIGQLEIKHRLPDFDPERFRRELRLRGDNSATLLIAAQGARRVAVAAQRIPSTTETPS